MNELNDWCMFCVHKRGASTLRYMSSRAFKQHWIAAEQPNRKSTEWTI